MLKYRFAVSHRVTALAVKVAVFWAIASLGILPAGMGGVSEAFAIQACPPRPPKNLAPDQFTSELNTAPTVQTFGCERTFDYDDETYFLDSYNRLDGERLRPFIKDIEPAVAQLNEYQDNKRRVRDMAYVGTGGLIVALGSFLAASFVEGSDSILIRNVGVAGGLAITAGAAIYSVSILNDNEDHIIQAVRYHNQAKPERKIELRFSTNLLEIF